MSEERHFLVLSGGGYKGAFQYAVIEALRSRGKLEGLYSVIGTSVGALNAISVANDDGGLTKAMWHDVIQGGLKFHSKGAMSYVNLGLSFLGLGSNSSLGFYSNKLAPQVADIMKQVKPSGPMYFCTVVDIDTHFIYYAYLSNIGENAPAMFLYDRDMLDAPYLFKVAGYDECSKVITGSTSIPGMFPPSVVRDTRGHTLRLVDGGVRDIAPLYGAVMMGATKVTVISCSPLYNGGKHKKPNRIDQMVGATIDIMTNEILRSDVDMFKMKNQIAEGGTGKYRVIPITVIEPPYNLMEDSLNPTQPELKNAWNLGTQLGSTVEV